MMALLSGLIALAGLMLAAGAVAQANGNNGNSDNGNNGADHDRVTLCHWVPAHGGSFITITVDVRGANGNPNDEGHASHPNDIIPAPASGCPSTAETPVATSSPHTTMTAVATTSPHATMTAVATTSPHATQTSGVGGTMTAVATHTAVPTSTGTAMASATNTAAPSARLRRCQRIPCD